MKDQWNAILTKAPKLDPYYQRKYGIDLNDYGHMYRTQHGLCAICRMPAPSEGDKRLVVDHDHSTDAVRGLLCSNCNSGLGMFADNQGRLAAAIVYLNAPRP